MAKLDSLLMKSKFRGCLLGSLVGDCLGAPFEGETMTSGNRLVLHNYFEKLSGPYFEAPFNEYTDDTAMTKCIVQSFIERPEIDFKHIAQLFVKEYFSEPKRGYGQNVVQVFHKLRNNRFSDIYEPAKQQFDGFGSYGNGGAMRITPVALYLHENYEAMINTARKITNITHSNSLAINGAFLQCIAVQEALLMQPQSSFNVFDFILNIEKKMKLLEKESSCEEIDVSELPYQNKLNKMVKLLEKKSPNVEEVIDVLGNGIAALHSVPTAIYCFLKTFSQDDEKKKVEDLFRNTIEYAISLGGDTDTIASMAGGLVGAYLGEGAVGDSLKRHCEFHDGIIEMADELYSNHLQLNINIAKV